MNEQASQAKRKDLPLPSSPPVTDWTSGSERVALELGSCPSDIPEDSYSMQVSFQYRWILQVKAAETLQRYQPSTLLFQVFSSFRSSYASSYVRYRKVESCVCRSPLLPGVSFLFSSQIPPKLRWHHDRFDTQRATFCFDHRYGVRGISNQSKTSVVNEAVRGAPPFAVCAANSLLRPLLRLTAAEFLSGRVARLTASLFFSFNSNICHF
jgi:hypothetical protein